MALEQADILQAVPKSPDSPLRWDKEVTFPRMRQ